MVFDLWFRVPLKYTTRFFIFQNFDPTENREYAFGHGYFSAEKFRDPDSRRRAPSFDSP
jgi:hypothetical protein